MGIFGPDLSVPDAGGWQTMVTPGSGDPNNLSLTEKMRLKLMGTTDANPALGKAFSTGADVLKGMGVAKPAPAVGGAPGAPTPQGGGLQGTRAAIDAIASPAKSPFASLAPGATAAPVKRPGIYGPFGAA